MENQFELDVDLDDLFDNEEGQDIQNEDEPGFDNQNNDSISEEDDTENNIDRNDDDDNEAVDDAISSFLKSYGIEDGKSITYEGENGETETVDFNSLSENEKFDILKQLSTPNLSDDEITTINYLRQNNATLRDVVEYYAQAAVQNYINQNAANTTKTYKIDDYSDDELYLASAKSKYPGLSDEELLADLESAKENEEVFKKKVEEIKAQYKQAEEDEMAAHQAEAENQYKGFVASVEDAIGNFSGISPNVVDEAAVDIVIEDSERDKIYEYITRRDANGYTEVFKDLNDPKKLVEFAWFTNFGKQAITDLTKYYTKIISESRKKNSTARKPEVVVKKDAKKEDSFKGRDIKSFELKGIDHLL